MFDTPNLSAAAVGGRLVRLSIISLALAVLAVVQFANHISAAYAAETTAELPVAAFTQDHQLNIRAFGARLDGRAVTDLSVTAGSDAIVSASAHFASSDGGKLIIICFPPAGASGLVNCVNTYTGRIKSILSPSRATIAGPYPGQTQTGGFAFFASDDTAALQAAIDATGDVDRSRTGVIKLPGRPAMISRTLLFENKSVEFSGQGMFATIVGNNPGTMLVWAGPAGMPMIRVLKCYGMRIHDLNLMGNSNPANRPSALIELANPPEVRHHPNSFNRLYNLHGGTSYAIGDPDRGVQAASGILLVDRSNNDRNMFDNVRLDSVGVGYDNRNRQAVVESLTNFTCDDCGVAVSLTQGGDLEVGDMELLSAGLSFDIGHGARIYVDYLANENSRGRQKGRSQLVRFEQGGGALTVSHGNYSLSCSIPADGVIVDTADNAPTWLTLSDFWFTRTVVCPAMVTPIIRFKANGTGRSAAAQRYLVCNGCRGMSGIKLDVDSGSDPRDTRMIAIREKPERFGGTGSDSFNLLQGPEGKFDPFRRDVPGKLNVMGGPMTVRELQPPLLIYGPSCRGGSGAQRYYYRVTARAGATETVGSPERAISCAARLSEAAYTLFYWMPVVGADSYGIYRGEAPGRERLLAIVPANSYPANVYPGNLQAGPMSGYKDIGAGPFGGFVPTVNTTGTAVFDGALRLGSTTFAALGPDPDGSEVYCRDCGGVAEGAACQRGGAGQLAVRIARVWKCF